ncbi:DUF87 domain-containing protein [Reyranella sp.]|uniref:type IV secretory system conjugative DNA transfer family protein n=1 Tax=Reyranella sp. TaxID=1929291 RepID=UPI0025EE1868|nr:DUF87 domain-containing protein [Reyranella sp.]
MPELRLVSTSVAEHPVRALETGLALCAFRLEAVQPLPAFPPAQVLSVQRLAESLRAGERACLALSARRGANGLPDVMLRISGHASVTKSVPFAPDLEDRMAVALAAELSGHRFARVVPEPTEAGDFPCLQQVRPVPMIVVTRAAGHRQTRPAALHMVASADNADGVALGQPRIADPVPLGRVLELLVEAAPFSISIDIEAVALSASDFRQIDRLVAAGFEWRLPSGAPAIGDPTASRRRIQSLLEAWCQTGAGWRMRCAIRSEKPVSAALARLLGEAVFARPATADAASQDEGGAVCVDLADAYPHGSTLPLALPSGSLLRRWGVPAFSPLACRLPAAGTLLGHLKDARGTDVRLPDAMRSRHVHVIGATGAGKSTLLFNMIVRDMRSGCGVTVIDPHGDLYAAVLGAVPRVRERDVITIDLADRTHAIGLNFLDVGERDRSVQGGLAINELLAITERLYDMKAVGGPIFELYCRSALQLLLESGEPGVTLIDLPRVFQSMNFRRRLVEKCPNPILTGFWREAERTTGDQALVNYGPYIASKFNRFVNHPLLRHVVGQARSTVDFRQAMDRGRIVLVNLAKGLVGEIDCRMAGMLVLGRLFIAAAGRADVSPASRRPMNLYVDEFQSMATTTMATMLSEGRKFGLALTLAHQTLGQLRIGEDNILHAVLGNAATLIALRVGPQDANALAPLLGAGVAAADLAMQPDFVGIVRLPAQDPPLPPLSLRTAPPVVESSERRARRIALGARRRTARLRSEVETEIRRRYASPHGEPSNED